MSSCKLSSVIGSNGKQVHCKSCAKLHLFDLLWICCGLVGRFQFVVQHLDMLRCYGFVIDGQFVVDLLYNILICCGFVVQLVVQQIHNKLNKWSLSSLLVSLLPPSNPANYRFNLRPRGHNLSLPSKRFCLKIALLCEFSISTNSLFFIEYACCCWQLLTV